VTFCAPYNLASNWWIYRKQFDSVWIETLDTDIKLHGFLAIEQHEGVELQRRVYPFRRGDSISVNYCDWRGCIGVRDPYCCQQAVLVKNFLTKKRRDVDSKRFFRRVGHGLPVY